VDVLFLDANILFSAAYGPDSRLRLLWDIPGAEMVTSTYAAEEAKRNLKSDDQRKRLDVLLWRTRLVAEAEASVLPADTILPEKDRPILAAALSAGATHLITGDRAHFGSWFGKTIGTLKVLPPAAYIEERAEQQTQQRKRDEPG
jgi:uncharacterized protein